MSSRKDVEDLEYLRQVGFDDCSLSYRMNLLQNDLLKDASLLRACDDVYVRQSVYLNPDLTLAQHSWPTKNENFDDIELKCNQITSILRLLFLLIKLTTISLRQSHCTCLLMILL